MAVTWLDSKWWWWYHERTFPLFNLKVGRFSFKIHYKIHSFMKSVFSVKYTVSSPFIIYFGQYCTLNMSYEYEATVNFLFVIIRVNNEFIAFKKSQLKRNWKQKNCKETKKRSFLLRFPVQCKTKFFKYFTDTSTKCNFWCLNKFRFNYSFYNLHIFRMNLNEQ